MTFGARHSMVSFTRMKDGTADDYELLEVLEAEYAAGTADRVLDHLKNLERSFAGYQISRLDHSLQTATRAARDGADIDWIVTALLHDIGDELAPFNHDSVAAAVIKPYVREECAWVCEHHGIFQMIYYAHFQGTDPEMRERFSRAYPLPGRGRLLRALGPGFLRSGLRDAGARSLRADGSRRVFARALGRHLSLSRPVGAALQLLKGWRCRP